jgi:hypothetical protein
LGGRASLIFEGSGAAEPGGDFLVFDTCVANFENAEAVHQEFAFSDDVNVVAIIEESDADGAVGNGAVTEELGGKRRHLGNHRCRWNNRITGITRFGNGMGRFWWTREFSAEDVAPTALIFGLASPFDSILMETGVFHGKELGVLGRGAGIGGYDRLVTIEIKITDDDQDQQKHDKYRELFLLLHAAVLK